MRFVPEKDPVLWIDTAAEIAKARPDVALLDRRIRAHGGRDPGEDRRPGLRDRIVLVGPLTMQDYLLRDRCGSFDVGH